MLSHLILAAVLISSVISKPSKDKDTSEFDPQNGLKAVTELDSGQVNAFLPFALFSQAAYCHPSKIKAWKCGLPCDNLKGFEPALADGNGGKIQYFFVGYWSKHKAVVVSHQGTDLNQLDAVLTDAKALRITLDPKLFPGVPEDVNVHAGFAETHARTAETVLKQVKALLKAKKSKTVYSTGHSLGGALATLETLYLTLHLPKDIKIKTVTFGMPRVGNPEFVKFFESKVQDYKRINNKADAVPAMPPRMIGYEHLKGEIHIVGDGKVFGCPSHDFDSDERCHAGDVSNGLTGNPADHLGPYPGGLRMGSFFCETAAEAESPLSEVRNALFDISSSLPAGISVVPFAMGKIISDLLGLFDG